MRNKVVKQEEKYVHPPNREDYVVGTKPSMIVASAVLKDGHVWTGNRHCDIISEIHAQTNKRVYSEEQGFWTEDGWYLRRTSALGVAIINKQVKQQDLINKRILTSEDLW